MTSFGARETGSSSEDLLVVHPRGSIVICGHADILEVYVPIRKFRSLANGPRVSPRPAAGGGIEAVRQIERRLGDGGGARSAAQKNHLVPVQGKVGIT